MGLNHSNLTVAVISATPPSEVEGSAALVWSGGWRVSVNRLLPVPDHVRYRTGEYLLRNFRARRQRNFMSVESKNKNLD